MSYSLNELRLDCNNRIKLNFDGGELSSDAGLLLLKEFAHKIGFHQLLQNSFKTNDKSNRYHTDDKNLLQKLYQLTAGYFQDDDSDELTTDPVLTTILEKEKLASQPTMSRFMNRCDDICLMQFESIHEELRRRIYSINKPQSILLDIDSTLFATFGKQEGNDYNQHYSNYGYHPLLVFDGLTGDLLKAELRSGNTYTSKGAPNFLYPLLLELQDEYPETNLCSRCNDSYTEEIPANGHSEGEFEVTKPAGWFTVGEEVQKCIVCNEILATQVIPSQYPIWYLYAGIGAVVAIIAGVVVFMVLRKKKSMNIATK